MIRWEAILALFAMLTLGGPITLAQQPIRFSYAGAEVAAARNRNRVESYNLKVGPVLFNLDAALDTEFNDNINLADDAAGSSSKQADIILRPRINVDASWQVTKLNQLRLSLGIGVEKHIDHPEADVTNLVIAPGSQLTFDIFVRDFRINLHDAFSLEQNPTSDPTLNNTSQYGRFTNTAGLSVLWDLNSVILTVGYDHTNVIATTDQGSFDDRQTELFSASAAMPFSGSATAGLQGSYAVTTYTEPVRPNGTVLSVGPFVDALLTPYTRISVGGGVQYYSFTYENQPEPAAPVIDPLTGAVFAGTESLMQPQSVRQEDDSGFYVSLGITNRLNAAYSHSLSLGRERQFSVGADYVDVNFIRYSASWSVIRNVGLSTSLFFEQGEAAGGLFAEPEEFTRFGLSLSIGYQLTKKLNVALRYAYISRNSELILRDYVQNVVGVTLRYDF